MASGSTSAQLSTPRPGKRWALTSQASPTPSPMETTSTPTVSTSVATIWSGSRVCHCWRHTSVFGRSTLVASMAIGTMARMATTTAATTQLGPIETPPTSDGVDRDGRLPLVVRRRRSLDRVGVSRSRRCPWPARRRR